MLCILMTSVAFVFECIFRFLMLVFFWLQLISIVSIHTFDISFSCASFYSLILMRNVFKSDDWFHYSIAQQRFSYFSGRLFNSMIASKSRFIFTSISSNMSIVSKNRCKVNCLSNVAFLAGLVD